MIKPALPILIALLLAAACTSAPSVSPTVYVAALPRQIATVDGTAVALATPPLALIPTHTLVPTATVVIPPTATPYIGVFLGDAGGPDGGLVDLNPARYAGTRVMLEPTPIPAEVCAIPPDAIYGTTWQGEVSAVRQLGCAGEPATDYPSGAVQVFERGVMYWLPTGEYFAIASSAPFGTYWYYASQPPSAPLPPDAQPPPGLRLPEDGFGIIWRAHAEVRRGLGYAQIEEANAQIIYQRFDGGALLYDGASAKTFLLLRDGTAYGPY